MKIQGVEDQFEMMGPDLILTPKSALALSLAVHELATNAAKFGALSRSGGRVSIQWRLTDIGGLDLKWVELGGPLVSAPTRRGFGSTLIERALAMETNGTAALHYLPEGVICEVALPSASMAVSAGSRATINFSNIRVENPQQTKAGIRILTIEDSFMIVSTLEMVFDSFGWTMVGPATRIPQALALVKYENFDIALLDINLDGEMSWDVAAALKARAIPFVLSTGYEVAPILPEFLRGVKSVKKPFQVHDLRRAIVDALAEHRNKI